MLTISGTLNSAQEASEHTPYCSADIITSEGVSSDLYRNNTGSNPLIYMREDTQVWSGEVEILLWNGDQGLSTKDYTGRRVKIRWGYVTAGPSNEDVEHASYWIVDQEFVGFAGTSYLKLTCWGVWDMMGIKATGGDSIIAAPSWPFDTTISAIIVELLSKIKLSGFTSSGIGLTVPGGNLDVTGDFAAGIFKAYEPDIITSWGESVRSIIRQVMDLTLCGLRMRSNGMHVLYPASGDAVNQTYQAGGFEVLSVNLHTSVAVPNRIIYVNSVPDISGSTDSHRGTANDTVSQGRVGIITQIFAPKAGATIGNNLGAIAGNDEAQQRANTILAKVQSESSTGQFVTHPSVELEVWDKVSVIDPITGTTTGGRVGRIETIWDATGLASPAARYIQTVELGGLTVRASNLSRYLGLGVNTTSRTPAIEPVPRPPLLGVPGIPGPPVLLPDPLAQRDVSETARRDAARVISSAAERAAANKRATGFEIISPTELNIPPELLERDISPETAAGMSRFRPTKPFTSSTSSTPPSETSLLDMPFWEKMFSRRFWSARLRGRDD